MQLSRVDLLIGLDNQRWMSKHVRSSLVEGDNLRLMQSVLGPTCAKRAAPDQEGQRRTGAVHRVCVLPYLEGNQ